MRGFRYDGDQVSESPVDAGRPSTTGPTRAYETSAIRVLWDATRCIHTANCLRALPSVFDAAARPWVKVEAAPPEEIEAAIRTCPTGALRYERLDGAPNEEGDQPATVEVVPGGPLFVRGRVRLTDGAGVTKEETRVALCRCGASGNKPFCDNSHRRIRFEA
jgi:uncharacterized Fe-S cluster protein YjdI